MPTVSAIIGGNIRYARARRHLTQKELGQRLGFSDGTIAQMELGRRTITVNELIPLCAALQVDLMFLLDGIAAEDRATLGL